MEKKYTIDEQYLGHKRENVLSWDESFMLHAVVAAGRSKDPNSQVGACIVGKNNRILSLGYNGAPNKWDDDQFPWDRSNEDPKDNKYPYVIHAEMNALLNYKGDNKDLEGSTVYVTLFPCHECAKCLAQAGIKRVVYLSDKYLGTDDNKMSKTCLEYCGVKYEGFPPELQRDFLVSLKADVGIKLAEQVKKGR
jgi:dCMP deaminase